MHLVRCPTTSQYLLSLKVHGLENLFELYKHGDMTEKAESS